MNIKTLGIDLAKNNFGVVGADQYDKVILRKSSTRKNCYRL
ncbi:MAG: hypothetical protein AAGF57_12105 [Pseudomonadota bacterium]